MDTKKYQFIRGARIAQQLDLETETLEETTYAELERNTMAFVPKTRKRQFAMASVNVDNMEFSPIQHAGNLLVEAQVSNPGSETKTNAVYGPKILFQEVEFVQQEGFDFNTELEEGIVDTVKGWWNKLRKNKVTPPPNTDAARAAQQDVKDTGDAEDAINKLDNEGEPEDQQDKPEEQPDHQPDEIVQTPGSITIQAKNGKEFTIGQIDLRKHNCRVYCNCLDFFWRFALYAHKGDSLLGTDLGIYKKKTNRPPNNPEQVPALCKHILKLAVELKNNGVVK